jgi:hypothetical protein
MWRRTVFEEVGGLRDDLHYVFDSEFGLRLALRGITPHIITGEIAVRYLHADAKSAVPQRFFEEWPGVRHDLLSQLGLAELARDLGYRLRRRIGQAFKGDETGR